MAELTARAAPLGDTIFGLIAGDGLSGAQRALHARKAMQASVAAAEAGRLAPARGDAADGSSEDEGLRDALSWRAGADAKLPATPGGTLLHACVQASLFPVIAELTGLLPALAEARDAAGRMPADLLPRSRLATSEDAREALEAAQWLRRRRLPQEPAAGGAGETREGEGEGSAVALGAVVEEPGEAEELLAAVQGDDGGMLGRNVGVRLYNIALARLEVGRVLSAQRLLRAADAAMQRGEGLVYTADERAAPMQQLSLLLGQLGHTKAAAEADATSCQRFDHAERAEKRRAKVAAPVPAGVESVESSSPKAVAPPLLPAAASTSKHGSEALTAVMDLAHEHAAAVELEWEEEDGDGSPWRDWEFEAAGSDDDARVSVLPYLPRFNIDESKEPVRASPPALTADVSAGQLLALSGEIGDEASGTKRPGNAVHGVARLLGRRWNALRLRRDGFGYMVRRWHRTLPGAPPAWVAFWTGFRNAVGHRVIAVLHDARPAPSADAPPQWRLEGFFVSGADELFAPHSDAPVMPELPDLSEFEGEGREAAMEVETAAEELRERMRRLCCADMRPLRAAFDDWRDDGRAQLPAPEQFAAAARAARAAAAPGGEWHTRPLSTRGGLRPRALLRACYKLKMDVAVALGLDKNALTRDDLVAGFGDDVAASEQRVVDAARDAIIAAADDVATDGEHTVAAFAISEWEAPKSQRAAAAGSEGAGGAGGAAAAAAEPTEAEEEPKERRLFLLPMRLRVPARLPGTDTVQEASIDVALQVEVVDDGAVFLPVCVFNLIRARAMVSAATPSSSMPEWLRKRAADA